ncbi:hypothetical protein COY32_00070, partial [candidate division WWE3 bacterium CG_4_10_14_0_2_um_filter_41_14]
MVKNKYILGIDVGGTNIKFGLVDSRYKLVESSQIPTPKTEKAVINLLIKIIEGKKPVIKAVGIGLPGPIDLKRGIILRTPHLPIKNVPILNLIKRHINKPLKIDNDANLFTLAEATVGAGKKYKNVVGITLGTGIGGGIVINKKIYHGRNNAGEVGHQFIDSHTSKHLESFLKVNNFKRSAEDY